MGGLRRLVSLAGVLVSLLGMLMGGVMVALLVMLGGRMMRLGSGFVVLGSFLVGVVGHDLSP